MSSARGNTARHWDVHSTSADDWSYRFWISFASGGSPLVLWMSKCAASAEHLAPSGVGRKRWDWESSPGFSFSNTKHYHWSSPCRCKCSQRFCFSQEVLSPGWKINFFSLAFDVCCRDSSLRSCNKIHFQTEAENIGPPVTHKKPLQPVSCSLRAATEMEVETGCKIEIFTVLALGVFG